MAIRVISGIIVASKADATDLSVTIRFNPHEVSAGSAPLAHTREVGPPGDFISDPCKHVALRQILNIAKPFTDNAGYIVNDQTTRDDITVEWDDRAEGHIQEISYLVIGEVPDPDNREEPVDRDDPDADPPDGGDPGDGDGSTDDDGRTDADGG